MGTRERRERSATIDTELSGSFISAASAKLSDANSVTLCAVGGYGRGELSPGSDLDLLILHAGSEKTERLTEFVNTFLYPLWSSGRAVDHSVRTRSQTREIANEDIRVAMGLLDLRLVAGNRELFDSVLTDSNEDWRKDYRRNFPKVKAAIKERAERTGELAFLLEPDLKEARGGLRDITALRAIDAAGVLNISLDRIGVAEALLANVRDVLHSILSKPRDQLMLTEQDQVAEIMQYADADALMLDIAKAARTVDYVMDLTWHRLDHEGSKSFFKRKSAVKIAKGLVLDKNEITIESGYDLGSDPEIGLRAAAAAAQRGVPLSIDACIAMAENFANLPTPWPRQAREDLVSLIGAGKEMIRVFEALDQEGLIEQWIAEWGHVRFLPQRNVLHHHTVDRHMLETAVHAAALTRTVKRPDLLLVAALLHDIGKGYAGLDHSEYGAELIEPLAIRIGFSKEDAEVLALLVKEHLLLSTVATRRDLDDPQTIQFVAEKVANPDTLELLHALSISDGEATGRSAWSDWKAGLVASLVSRVLSAMAGTKPVAQPELTPPANLESDLNLKLTSSGGVVDVEIIARDQVGLLSVVAGVFTISRLEVRSARTKTTDDVAVMRWTVSPDPNAEYPEADKLLELIQRGLNGEIDLAKRIDERVNSYRKYPGIPTPPPIVSATNDIATNATVIEVRMHDRPGVLFTVAKAISRFGVDINAAIVSTLGAEAFDTLYVSDISGSALSEAQAKLLANQVENILLTSN